ncbi:hypothetical protein Bbelb_280630 [Branchiostoma belcheri]|nr:hypothetical protein Bbelb_280630 [Branchiostoma belcheri]
MVVGYGRQPPRTVVHTQPALNTSDVPPHYPDTQLGRQVLMGLRLSLPDLNWERRSPSLPASPPAPVDEPVQSPCLPGILEVYRRACFPGATHRSTLDIYRRAYPRAFSEDWKSTDGHAFSWPKCHRRDGTLNGTEVYLSLQPECHRRAGSLNGSEVYRPPWRSVGDGLALFSTKDMARWGVGEAPEASAHGARLRETALTSLGVRKSTARESSISGPRTSAAGVRVNLVRRAVAPCFCGTDPMTLGGRKGGDIPPPPFPVFDKVLTESEIVQNRSDTRGPALTQPGRQAAQLELTMCWFPAGDLRLAEKFSTSCRTNAQ